MQTRTRNSLHIQESAAPSRFDTTPTVFWRPAPFVSRPANLPPLFRPDKVTARRLPAGIHSSQRGILSFDL